MVQVREDGNGCVQQTARETGQTDLATVRIRDKMDENNETTAGEMSAMIYRDMGLKVSPATIKDVRRRMGWSNCSVKYAQMV